MKYFLFILAWWQLSMFAQSQVLISYDFQTDIAGWNTYGDVQATWISQGANTSGAAQVEVLSDDGNVAHRRFYSAYIPFTGYDDKMLLVKLYAKSPTLATLRIKAELHNNGQYRSVRYDYSLTDTYEKYILPVRIKPGDTDLRINLQIGSATGVYYFDDISFEYVTYDVNDIQQFENRRTAVFYYEPAANQQTLSANTASIQIDIDTSQVVAPVLNTQIGVNSNFRSRNSLVGRAHLYESFGAFRFPAGSGSDLYFWDGNVPANINGYSGTASNFLDPDHFAQFKDLAGGEATVVVNYAYARMGETSDGTREARVSQAAQYAAGFVDKLNLQLNAGVKYWEIGNESYGAWEPGYDVNGSIITPVEYGEDFRVFVDSMKVVDPNIKIGAVLSHKKYYWNKDVLKEVEDKADYLIFHHYLSNVETADGTRSAVSAVQDDILEIMLFAKEYTLKPFGYYPLNMTEYNSQGYHTTTMANALFITNLLATLIENRINLATIWVNEWNINNNESHGILAKNDPYQQDYTARPAYIPFYYFPKYFGSRMVQAQVTGDTDLLAYASVFDSGETAVVVTNFSDTPKEFSLNFAGSNNYDVAFWYGIYADNIDEGNTKFYVNGQTASTTGGGPEDLDVVMPGYATYQQGNSFVVQAYSVNFITLGKLPVTQILAQPVSVSLCKGETAVFQVDASGQNLLYQWKKDGVDINGATTSQYILHNISPTDAGDYTCVVTGDFGSLTSDVVHLAVQLPVQIVNQPVDVSVDEGETAFFSVVAQGSNLMYQWQFNNQDIPGAVTDTYIIDNVQAGDAGVYKVIVTGDCGQVVSDEANLNVVLGWEEGGMKTLKIYPVPVNEILFVELFEQSPASLQIIDATGKIIIECKLSDGKNQIDVSELKQSLYFLRIWQNGSLYYDKMLKG